ncbi:MAG: hypothetical protein HQK89_10340 [Nitrospirae bacterium]|nr:hypothetical protein [Nitrospirota bacterium]
MIYDRQNTLLRHAAMVLGIALIISCIFLTLWLRTSIKSLEYRLGNLQQKQYLRMKEQRNLQAKRDNLLSFASIDNVAIKKMGFSFPNRNKVFHVKERI